MKSNSRPRTTHRDTRSNRNWFKNLMKSPVKLMGIGISLVITIVVVVLIAGPKGIMNFDPEVCKLSSLFCSQFEEEYKAQIPQSRWSDHIKVILDTDPNSQTVSAADCENTAITVNVKYLPLLNSIGISQLAGHEGTHLTACTEYTGRSNALYFDPTVTKRVPITGIRGLAIMTEYARIDLWEEGAACYLTACPDYIQGYEAMHRLVGDLAAAAGWNKDKFWSYRDDPNLFPELCKVAYSKLNNGAICDVPVLEAMMYRLPATYFREDGNQLSKWAELASDTRHRNFEDVQNIAVIWEFEPASDNK
jgi:hypothetical protein